LTLPTPSGVGSIDLGVVFQHVKSCLMVGRRAVCQRQWTIRKNRRRVITMLRDEVVSVVCPVDEA
jgi:hypothetical protein